MSCISNINPTNKEISYGNISATEFVFVYIKHILFKRYTYIHSTYTHQQFHVIFFFAKKIQYIRFCIMFKSFFPIFSTTYGNVISTENYSFRITENKFNTPFPRLLLAPHSHKCLFPVMYQRKRFFFFKKKKKKALAMQSTSVNIYITSTLPTPYFYIFYV